MKERERAHLRVAKQSILGEHGTAAAGIESEGTMLVPRDSGRTMLVPPFARYRRQVNFLFFVVRPRIHNTVVFPR
jgi:hypothetical protein